MVIVFEGHDGSGKTTLIEQLKKDLISCNRSVITIKCPPEDRKDLFIIDANDLQKSFDFYLECCIHTSVKIAEYRSIVDYILLDRYYFSTIISHEARGFSVDRTLFESLEKVDLKIQIKTNENIRKKRLFQKKDIQAHDVKTLNSDLIRRADELYSTLGFTIIENNRNIKQTLIQTKKIIKNYGGK
jgi:thymidylate kinase